MRRRGTSGCRWSVEAIRVTYVCGGPQDRTTGSYTICGVERTTRAFGVNTRRAWPGRERDRGWLSSVSIRAVSGSFNSNSMYSIDRIPAQSLLSRGHSPCSNLHVVGPLAFLDRQRHTDRTAVPDPDSPHTMRSLSFATRALQRVHRHLHVTLARTANERLPNGAAGLARTCAPYSLHTLKLHRWTTPPTRERSRRTLSCVKTRDVHPRRDIIVESSICDIGFLQLFQLLRCG